MARVILSLLGGYVVILLLMTVHDWFMAEYPRPPAESTRTERIRHPYDHEQARDALEQFSNLDKPERQAIVQRLRSNLVPMAQWMNDLDRSAYQVICMGELHDESVRRSLAEAFFTSVRIDVLMLEATPDALRDLIKRMQAGRRYFPLLGADIMKILRAVRSRNPDVRICGIEETTSQQKLQRGHSGSRDQAIAGNFWNCFEPGKRHLILFGALHCTNERNWLFENLRGKAPLAMKDRMLNLLVLGEHQQGPLEAFVFFLDGIGIATGDFVIPDTRSLHPRIGTWFQTLNRQTLQKYRTLIVFRR